MSDSHASNNLPAGDDLRITSNAALDDRNTFRVAARAATLIEVGSVDALRQALDHPGVRSGPLLVLGEGSNLLFADDFAGTVLAIGLADVRIIEEPADYALVRADAGADWDALVRWTLGRGLQGLENLALIPGTVGAAPIQNIGAYGGEVGEFIENVEAFDREGCVLRTLSADACAFGYRDSRFKHEPTRWIVTAVTFRLPRTHALRLDYAGIREELATMSVIQPTALDVADAVTRLRRRKLPDPDVIGNAGSFFKNPLVDAATADALKSSHSMLPVFPVGDPAQRKLSAAWMIEAGGWKGHRDGDAGVSAQHALVLVNHAHATGAQLLDLARRVAASVHERFGVQLEPEPRVIGSTW
ncbi:MAG TPA: UDP-N-acetylmuramate dehydrogenase [Xanthomonadaceae bacterium]|nr:UDP-N-acetylmuramate dehydrogenase [Xanthomonadaceae bacterium]